MLTRETANQLLKYDALSGKFSWKVNGTRIRIGQSAGSIWLGYNRIKIKQKNYAAHRIAWLLTYGEWPVNEIDHINGDRSDNRICNLREATHAQNIQNCINRNPNKHGLRGIAKQTCSRGWMAKIASNGIKHHLGTYATPEDAHAAYIQAAKKLHGNFANLKTANHKEIPMSRKPSIVLTPAEKKAALTEAKTALKAAQAAVKQLVAEAKIVAKARAAEDKVQAGLVKAADKSLAAAQAGVDALAS